MDSFSDPWQTPPVLDGLSSDQMDSLAELHEGAFEPQLRARSNTWPLPRPDNFVEPSDDTDNNQQSSNQQSGAFFWLEPRVFSTDTLCVMQAASFITNVRLYNRNDTTDKVQNAKEFEK